MPRTIGQIKKDKRSKSKKQTDFLAKLIEYISITRAAKISKIGRQTVYDWISNDVEFKIAYDRACEVATAKLEDEAVRRSYEGTLKPIYQGGKKVGTIREYSDTLLIVLLKARAPEKYKERFEQKAVNTNLNYNVEMSKEEMKEISKALENDY